LTRSQIFEKSTVVQQNARMAELMEANVQLVAEVNAARCRLVEVEHRKQALSSDYEGLCRDFDDLSTSHDAVVKEKTDLEKTECEKAQRFQNSLHKKLAELRVNMEATVAVLGVMHGFSLRQHYCHRFFGAISDDCPGSTHRLF
jgi:chromosome segregation ATPase